MVENKTETIVRYADTDHGGHVYYGNYFKWFEIGRTELMRQIGFSYADFEKKGFLVPVVHAECNYNHPTRYDETVIIKTSAEKVGTTSITFQYQIIRKEDNTILAEGRTTNVCVNMKEKKPNPIPAEMKKALGH